MGTKLLTFSKMALLMAAVLLGFSNCNKSLKDDVDDLKNRVGNLESAVAALEDAVEQGKLISTVTPLSPTTGASGWTITFSDNKTIDVLNGTTGSTPYMWVNANGNWASNLDSKPADSDDPKYELKMNGSSVKSNGLSVRVVDLNGYVGFEEYDAITNETKKQVATTFPYSGGKVITAIAESTLSYTFTIDGANYTVAKAAVYPTSITVLRFKDYIIKGEEISFGIRINPAASQAITKEDLSLDYVQSYAITRAYGVNPDFIKIKDLVPTETQGEYTLTLGWAASDAGFAKDAAIFIVLTYTSATGELTEVISSTPVIINEQFKSIALENVLALPDVEMFSDETYVDSTRLKDYNEGYVNTVAYALGTPNILQPIGRYLPEDKYQFSIEADNALWATPTTLEMTTPVTVTVTDYGVPEVPATPARPEIGQAASSAIPAITPTSVIRTFNVTVFRAQSVIETFSYGDRWMPNEETQYSFSEALSTVLTTNGYDPAKWNLAIDGYSYTRNGGLIQTALPESITANTTGFAAPNYTFQFDLAPTILDGTHMILLNLSATPKTPRHSSLKQERKFAVKFTFNIVAPKFEVLLQDAVLPSVVTNVYTTYKYANVNITDLFNVNSNRNVSLLTDVTPNAVPLSYKYDITTVQGAQGLKFMPYPTVEKPALTYADHADVPVTVFVRLNTGQEIPVTIKRSDVTTPVNGNGSLIVRFARRNLDHVNAVTATFNGNYDRMITTGISIGANANFTPADVSDNTLDPTTIKSIVYSAKDNVSCENGSLPSGLSGVQILKIDAQSGVVTSNQQYTWSDETLIMRQTFTVTYTDIWGNAKSRDVVVRVKSNSIP